MRASRQGLAEIVASEGIVPFPYRDSVGVWTFGVGHTAAAGGLDPAELAKGREQPLTKVMGTFRDDVRKFERRVASAVRVPLAQHEFDALVSFDFNTGGIGRAKITRELNLEDRAGAKAAFDNWHRPPEIIPRRNREKDLFATGRYASNGRATKWPADSAGRVLWSQGQVVDVLPAIDAVMDANDADDAADTARTGTVAAGGGGATTGGLSTGVDPSSVDVSDPQAVKVFLALLAIALFVAAALFAVRWFRSRRRAKTKTDVAAMRLSTAIGTATRDPGTAPRFLGRGRHNDDPEG